MWVGPGRELRGQGAGQGPESGSQGSGEVLGRVREPGSEGKAQGVGGSGPARASRDAAPGAGVASGSQKELPQDSRVETTPPLCGSPTRRGPSLFHPHNSPESRQLSTLGQETLSLERRVMTKLLLVPGVVRPAPLGTRRPALCLGEVGRGRAEAAAVGIWLVPDQGGPPAMSSHPPPAAVLVTL